MEDGLLSETATIEILDGGPGGTAALRLISFWGDECRVTPWRAQEPNPPAVRGPSGWVFVGGTAPGADAENPTSRISLLGAGGDPFFQQAIELRSPWSDSAAVFVSRTPRGVIVSSRLFPFAWSAVAEDNRISASGRFPAGDEAYYSSDPWVATGVFALDIGFVQVLADLASDRRHLVIYDPSGAFTRRRVIDVPFGILDTAPSRRQLLALRRTDRVEVLTYEWTWHHTGPENKSEPETKERKYAEQEDLQLDDRGRDHARRRRRDAGHRPSADVGFRLRNVRQLHGHL